MINNKLKTMNTQLTIPWTNWNPTMRILAIKNITNPLLLNLQIYCIPIKARA
jgi:hypothetical protein